jgi:exo-1,4-beta-D-glucosaminidase
LLRTEGAIHKAELWVNGTQVAGTDEIAGAYPVHTFDVTRLVKAGANAMALRVHPGNP